MTGLYPQPVPVDSTNSRQHRGQMANAVNALLKKVFDVDTDLSQQIITLTGSSSAAWAVNLNVNGHVVGSVHLDGTSATSEFAVEASKFTVYNGTSTVPAFQITGGIAYLNVPLQANSVIATNIAAAQINNSHMTTSSVDTPNIVAKAATDPAIVGGLGPTVTFTTGTLTIPGVVTAAKQYLAGSLVCVEFTGSYQFGGSYTGALCYLRCRRSDGTLMSGSSALNSVIVTTNEADLMARFFDTSPLGTPGVTYQMEFAVINTPAGTASLRLAGTLFSQEFKK